MSVNMILKAFKYRIYPNKTQTEHFNKAMGCARYVYNKGLELKIKEYESSGKSLSCFDLTNGMLKQEKSANEWLKEPYSQCLQMSLRNLDNAFTRFFRKKKGFPKFHSKKGKQSIQYPQFVKVDFENQKLILPKCGAVKTVFSRQFEGKIKTTTISKTRTGKFFVSILVEINKKLPKKPAVAEKTTVGVDLGIKDFLITSKGEKVSNPKFLSQELQRLKVLQHRASKKTLGSANRRKANLKVAKLFEKISNQREDFLHQTSTRIIRDNQTIVLEDLAVKNMMQNHKLARAIGDCSWSKFVELLKYKAEWYGVNIMQIGRFEPSSKTCSVCGSIKQDLTLADRIWKCKDCGTEHDRDINAAVNIKKFGIVKNISTGWESPEELRDTPAVAG